jgi:hypothetical protein
MHAQTHALMTRSRIARGKGVMEGTLLIEPFSVLGSRFQVQKFWRRTTWNHEPCENEPRTENRELNTNLEL